MEQRRSSEYAAPIRAYLEQSNARNEAATHVNLCSKKAWVGGLLVHDMNVMFTEQTITVQIYAEMKKKVFEWRVEEVKRLLSYHAVHSPITRAFGMLELKETARVHADVSDHLNVNSKDLRLRCITWELENTVWVNHQRCILKLCGFKATSGSWQRLELSEDGVSYYLDRSTLKPSYETKNEHGSMFTDLKSNETNESFDSDSLGETMDPDLHLEDEFIRNGGAPFQKILFPKGDRDAVLLTEEDVLRLHPKLYLNDTLVDFYIKYLNIQLPVEQQKKYHFFNSFFYTKLLEGQNSEDSFKRVTNWTRNVDIFSKEFVFVPINERTHWSVAIICHLKDIAPLQVPSDAKVENVYVDKSPCIIHLDSMEGSHQGAFMRLRNYLREEWIHRFQAPRSETAQLFRHVKFFQAKVPQQTNTFDCGLFLLHYVELFIKENPAAVCLRMDHRNYPHFLNERWFRACEASSKRSRLRKIILNLGKQNESLEPFEAERNREKKTEETKTDKVSEGQKLKLDAKRFFSKGSDKSKLKTEMEIEIESEEEGNEVEVYHAVTEAVNIKRPKSDSTSNKALEGRNVEWREESRGEREERMKEGKKEREEEWREERTGDRPERTDEERWGDEKNLSGRKWPRQSDSGNDVIDEANAVIERFGSGARSKEKAARDHPDGDFLPSLIGATDEAAQREERDRKDFQESLKRRRRMTCDEDFEHLQRNLDIEIEASENPPLAENFELKFECNSYIAASSSVHFMERQPATQPSSPAPYGCTERKILQIFGSSIAQNDDSDDEKTGISGDDDDDSESFIIEFPQNAEPLLRISQKGDRPIPRDDDDIQIVELLGGDMKLNAANVKNLEHLDNAAMKRSTYIGEMLHNRPEKSNSNLNVKFELNTFQGSSEEDRLTQRESERRGGKGNGREREIEREKQDDMKMERVKERGRERPLDWERERGNRSERAEEERRRSFSPPLTVNVSRKGQISPVLSTGGFSLTRKRDDNVRKDGREDKNFGATDDKKRIFFTQEDALMVCAKGRPQCYKQSKLALMRRVILNDDDVGGEVDSEGERGADVEGKNGEEEKVGVVGERGRNREREREKEKEGESEEERKTKGRLNTNLRFTEIGERRKEVRERRRRGSLEKFLSSQTYPICLDTPIKESVRMDDSEQHSVPSYNMEVPRRRPGNSVYVRRKSFSASDNASETRNGEGEVELTLSSSLLPHSDEETSLQKKSMERPVNTKKKHRDADKGAESKSGEKRRSLLDIFSNSENAFDGRESRKQFGSKDNVSIEESVPLIPNIKVGEGGDGVKELEGEVKVKEKREDGDKGDRRELPERKYESIQGAPDVRRSNGRWGKIDTIFGELQEKKDRGPKEV